MVGVLYTHFVNWDAQSGQLGVRLFFVLSGFLITSRLLEACDKVAAGAATRREELVRFYIRRALRIFPAYYLLLAIPLLLNVDDLRASAPWHLFYLTNFWYALTNDWSSWIVVHFWTLGIEEQFYLFWPFLLLFAPRNALPWLFGTVIAMSLMFRLQVMSSPLALTDASKWMMTFSSTDALAAGAMLALVPHTDRRLMTAVKIAGLIATVLWLFCFVLDHSGAVANADALSYLAGNPLNTIAFSGLIAWAADRPQGPAARVLAAPPLVALGRISYGVYLYHIAVAAALQNTFALRDESFALFACASLATLVVATASWWLLERPMLLLKDRFRP